WTRPDASGTGTSAAEQKAASDEKHVVVFAAASGTRPTARLSDGVDRRLERAQDGPSLACRHRERFPNHAGDLLDALREISEQLIDPLHLGRRHGNDAGGVLGDDVDVAKRRRQLLLNAFEQLLRAARRTAGGDEHA